MPRAPLVDDDAPRAEAAARMPGMDAQTTASGLVGWWVDARLSDSRGYLLSNGTVIDTWECSVPESGADALGLLIHDCVQAGGASVVVPWDAVPCLVAGETYNVGGVHVRLRPPSAPAAPPADW